MSTLFPREGATAEGNESIVCQRAALFQQQALITKGLSESSLAEGVLMGLVKEMKRHCPLTLH